MSYLFRPDFILLLVVPAYNLKQVRMTGGRNRANRAFEALNQNARVELKCALIVWAF